MDKFRFYFVKIFCVTLNRPTECISTLICVSLKVRGGPPKLGLRARPSSFPAFPFPRYVVAVRTDRKYCGESHIFIITDTVIQESKFKAASNTSQYEFHQALSPLSDYMIPENKMS